MPPARGVRLVEEFDLRIGGVQADWCRSVWIGVIARPAVGSGRGRVAGGSNLPTGGRETTDGDGSVGGRWGSRGRDGLAVAEAGGHGRVDVMTMAAGHGLVSGSHVDRQRWIDALGSTAGGESME